MLDCLTDVNIEDFVVERDCLPVVSNLNHWVLTRRLAKHDDFHGLTGGNVYGQSPGLNSDLPRPTPLIENHRGRRFHLLIATSPTTAIRSTSA